MARVSQNLHEINSPLKAVGSGCKKVICWLAPTRPILLGLFVLTDPDLLVCGDLWAPMRIWLKCAILVKKFPPTSRPLHCLINVCKRGHFFYSDKKSESSLNLPFSSSADQLHVFPRRPRHPHRRLAVPARQLPRHRQQRRAQAQRVPRRERERQVRTQFSMKNLFFQTFWHESTLSVLCFQFFPN